MSGPAGRHTGDTALMSALTGPEISGPRLILEACSPFKVLLANPAWCAIMGYSADEIVGSSVALLHGELTCCDTLNKLERAMTGAPLRPTRDAIRRVLASHPLRLVTGLPLQPLHTPLRAVGRKISVMLVHYKKNRTPILCNVWATPLVDSQGAPNLEPICRPGRVPDESSGRAHTSFVRRRGRFL